MGYKQPVSNLILFPNPFYVLLAIFLMLWQDTNRKKTKEEILAEERDYKRRRMSYRAKKVKRTPMQVELISGLIRLLAL